MTRANPLYSRFNAGELSPRMVARTDFPRYVNGLALMENLIPLPQGGAMRRAGTRYVAAVKNETQHVHLMPFEFNTEQAFVLEVGAGYFRFFSQQGQVVTQDVAATITNGTFDADVTGWTDQSTGTGTVTWNSTTAAMELTGTGTGNEGVAEQQVNSGGYANVRHTLMFRVRGPAILFVNLRIGTTSGAADIVNDLRFNTGYHVFSFSPQTDSFFIQFRTGSENQIVDVDDVEFLRGVPLELGSPYTLAQVHDVRGPQSADVMYLLHGDHPPHKLQRFASDWWSLEQVAFVDGPYQDMNTDSGKTLKPDSTTGRRVLIRSSGHSPFTADSLGRLIRISNPASGTSWGAARIVNVPSDNLVVADVIVDFATTTHSADWQLGEWSDARGYPALGTFFEQRLVLANSESSPQTLWMSQTADFENFTPDDRAGTVEDDDALNYTISSDQIDQIQWLVALTDLVIGTSGGEWTLGSDGPVVKPTDTEVRRHTTHGSASLEPVRNGPHVLFLQRAKRKVRQFTLDTLLDAFRAVDLTRLADHVTYSNVHEMSFAQEPHLQMWAVREDGEVAVLTHSPEEEVIGWARYLLGGAFAGGNAVVESVASVPGNSSTSSDDRDEVWLIVKRTINGSTRRYVEFIEKDFETGHLQEDAFYVDSGLTYSGSAVTVITGLSHLVGETVAIWGDGSILPTAVVASDGTVTLARSVGTAQVGLPYKHRMRSLKLDVGGAAGTAMGKRKRAYAIGFVLLNAMKFLFGPSESSLQSKDFRVVSDPMDTAPPLFTGETVLEFSGEYATDPRWYIESDDPAPFTLLASTPEVQTNDVK